VLSYWSHLSEREREIISRNHLLFFFVVVEINYLDNRAENRRSSNRNRNNSCQNSNYEKEPNFNYLIKIANGYY
jgi:hypothetical protein